jgi:glycosyltransferase involved in cell wall biosynthesis
VLFTHTCYLPLTIRTPNVLLMQDARYFCDIGAAAGVLDDQGLGFLLKKYWTYRSLRTARVVTVQSNTLADSIAARIPSAAPRIRVIPHGPGFLDGPQPRTPAAMWRGETLELLCISLFRKYKNFPVLLRMLRSLRTSQIPARLHLTLDETDPGVGQLWREARGLGVEDCLVNHGEVRTEQLSQLYRDADAFVFASVCESFGFPLIEAMSFGIPVFAADTPINREICGPAAAYFPPGDPQSLADLLRCYLARPELRSSASQESIRRSQRFSWTSAGEQTLNLILDQLPNSCAPGQSRV